MIQLGGDPERVWDQPAVPVGLQAADKNSITSNFPAGTVVRVSPKPLVLEALVRLAVDACNGWAQVGAIVHMRKLKAAGATMVDVCIPHPPEALHATCDTQHQSSSSMAEAKEHLTNRLLELSFAQSAEPTGLGQLVKMREGVVSSDRRRPCA